jgi:ribose-phosphate pyrophosphokinase
MLSINLVVPSRSDIPYKITEFSDGQKLITLLEPKRALLEEDIIIKSRMSWGDLQIVIQVVSILRSLRVQNIVLNVPYFLGARSDRQFTNGQVNYMKDIICPLINDLGVEVVVTDPHSIVLESCLNKVTTNTYLDTMIYGLRSSGRISQKYCLVAPDEGAIKRVEATARGLMNPPSKIIKCLKHRDVHTGSILGLEVLSDDLGGMPCVVLDDICDGGATFLALANELLKKGATEMHLCVSHGIFSRGFKDLFEHYSTISTTNSIKDFPDEAVESGNKLFIYDVFR